MNPVDLTSRFNYYRICILISLPPYDKYNTIRDYGKNRMMFVWPARTEERDDIQRAEGKEIMTLETIWNKEALNKAGRDP
jgi:hypothetical protein